MKAIATILLIFFFGITAQAQDITKDIKVEPILMTIVDSTTFAAKNDNSIESLPELLVYTNTRAPELENRFLLLQKETKQKWQKLRYDIRSNRNKVRY
ncbi:hypothetical protein [Maribacter sp. HTCC2170]|uniref:hypothetical protein n=1 Tax=Maribacter sp. (strain HTCC2170 / KCCM 42371) TaxID=313603 RepID=UPI00006AFC4E|nr:hypothetical protein [Maribacter sp. HTCC2170]EAR01309.1 hypothetical protein FB2170_11331 [Maribacter sp. HTCC2170]